MSVFYRLHQDQSVGTRRSGKWYARAVPMSTINTRQLAEIMQRNCTVKKADILAVLDELVETMRDQMQDSKRVKLDGPIATPHFAPLGRRRGKSTWCSFHLRINFTYHSSVKSPWK